MPGQGLGAAGLGAYEVSFQLPLGRETGPSPGS